jgi:hypothetical protein
MAVGPDQLEDRFKEEIKVFERLIDETLMRASLPGRSGRICVDAPRGMLDHHFKILKEIYESAGWTNVSREFGDQRDPCDAITFEK